MKFLEDNHRFISKYHTDLEKVFSENLLTSDIEIHTARTGQKVPCFKGNGKKIFLHSKFDPEKEAARFISEINTGDYDLFIVFGFGFAFHIQELLKVISRDSRLMIIEKDKFLLRSAFEHRELADVLSDSRVILLLDPSEDDIAGKMKGRSSRSVSFVTHRGSYSAYPEYYNNMLQICRSYISTKEVNIATLAKFEKTWTANISRNIRKFIKTPGVDIFYNRLNNLPALVICAGPSLDESIDFIKQNKNSFVLVAVDTALRVLLKNDIEPHFCVCVDPQVVNARYFEGITISRTVLVTDPTVHPSVFRLFRGRVVTTGIVFEMMKWIEKRTGHKGDIAHGGSVSTNAYDFARRTGASPVYITGQDLAFTGGLAHCRGSYLDEQIHIKTDRLMTAEMFNRRQLRALPEIKVRGIKSEYVSTNQKMMIFLAWFRKQNDTNLVNLTYNGAYLTGVRHENMDDITGVDADVDIDALVDSVYSGYCKKGSETADSMHQIEQDIDKMLNEISDLIPVLEKAAVFAENLLKEFSGENKDRGRIDYILKKLSGADDFIQKKVTVKDMISFTVQRVIHTITEGYEIDESDSEFSREELIAKRSLFLYRGLLEGAVFNNRILNKMKKTLKIGEIA